MPFLTLTPASHFVYSKAQVWLYLTVTERKLEVSVCGVGWGEEEGAGARRVPAVSYRKMYITKKKYILFPTLKKLQY